MVDELFVAAAAQQFGRFIATAESAGTGVVRGAARLYARLPDSDLRRLDGIGHAPICTAPATMARLIDRRFTQAKVATA